MKKFYLTNGKRVRIGDVIIKKSKKVNSLFGEIITCDYVEVTNENLHELIKAGVIIDKSTKNVADTNTNIPMDLEYYIQNIANKLNWKIENAYNYLDKIDFILPAAALSMILREIAIELDKKYDDHIEKSPEIYVISTMDGRITKANKAHIKNYRNFAAFRSIEDAKIACRITKDIIKNMFKSGK